MKQTIILVLFIFTIGIANAQQQIDNIQLKCYYKYDYTRYSINSVKTMVDTMLLEVGNKSCKFFSYYNYLIDSICQQTPGVCLSGMYRKTSNQNIIYINYPENKTTLLGHPSGVSGKFEYTEDFEIPKWTIHKETQKILSHICKKASCSFKGRDYVAWYAIDIPISRGPYKFAGLPGLIMKIADTENLYSFECIAIEKCNQPMYKDKVDKVRFISKKEFFNMEKRSHDNYKAALVQMLKDQGTLNIDEFVNKLSIPEGAKIKYNPIELE